MKSEDYLYATLLPIIAFVFLSFLGLIFSYVMYSDVSSIYEMNSHVIQSLLFSIPIFLINILIPAYMGWNIVKVFRGNLVNCMISGAILGSVRFVLSVFIMILTYHIIPVYKLVYAPFLVSGSLGGILIVALLLFSLVLTVGWDLGLAAFGGFVCRELQEK